MRLDDVLVSWQEADGRVRLWVRVRVGADGRVRLRVRVRVGADERLREVADVESECSKIHIPYIASQAPPHPPPLQ